MPGLYRNVYRRVGLRRNVGLCRNRRGLGVTSTTPHSTIEVPPPYDLKDPFPPPPYQVQKPRCNSSLASCSIM